MRNKKLIVIFSVLVAITLLVVFNSVLFSVQHVNAYCYNVAPEEVQYEQQILSGHKIKRGTSIFFVNKSKTAQNVESATGNRVKVINIEKKFPNRIYINYVEVKVYAYIENGADKYYLGNDMTVMQPRDGEGAIKLVLGADVGNFNEGDKFDYTTQSGINSAAVLTQIFNGLERCGYTHNDIVSWITQIDLSGRFIKLQTAKGLEIEIINAESLQQKIRLAVSIYHDERVNVEKGVLIITGANSASYRNGGSVTDVNV